jgi:peptidoglycan/xylan/chitin deacetylase (PgdA/CDA1 family)
VATLYRQGREERNRPGRRFGIPPPTGGCPVRELVLLLHGLGEPHSSVDSLEAPYWWSTASFARLLDQVLEFPKNAEPKILITFDDGNASDALSALPELSKRRLTAEFFVCAGRVGKKHYLDQSMIKELLSEGMKIGSHGMDHRDWRTLDAIALDVEIGDARRKLEDITQRKVDGVSIPFGSYDRRVLRRLKREPWEIIYTADRGTTSSTSRIKTRETLDAGMQGVNVLSKFLASPPMHVRAGHVLSRLYKQLR